MGVCIVDFGVSRCSEVVRLVAQSEYRKVEGQRAKEV